MNEHWFILPKYFDIYRLSFISFMICYFLNCLHFSGHIVFNKVNFLCYYCKLYVFSQILFLQALEVIKLFKETDTIKIQRAQMRLRITMTGMYFRDTSY